MREPPQPFLFMVMPHGKPVIKLVTGDGKTFTDTLHSIKSRKVLRKNTEDKEQSISGIGNDKIREDGMCMPTGADEPCNTEFMTDRFSVDKVGDGTAITGMDMAGTLSAAAWTGSDFRTESFQKRIKESFR